MSNVSARQEPTFPWDIVVPENDFWNDLDNNIGRNFIANHTDDELSRMHFDASLTKEEKLRFLRDNLYDKLTTKYGDTVPPSSEPVAHSDYFSLRSAIVHLDYELGDVEAAIAATRELYALSNESTVEGNTNKSLLFSLFGMLQEVGQYAEAEGFALEALDWVSGLDKVGPNSPQALGCMRAMVTCTWKQGKHLEAQGWIGRCEKSIEAMGKTDFAKYVPEEKEELEKRVKLLQEWKPEKLAKI